MDSAESEFTRSGFGRSGFHRSGPKEQRISWITPGARFGRLIFQKGIGGQAQTGNLRKSLEGPWRLKRGYTQVCGYTQAFGFPAGATHGCLSMPRCLDPQLGLHTGVWSPNRGYTQVFGSPAGATHGCLESKPGLHTGVWSPKRAIVQVATLTSLVGPKSGPK